MTTTLAKQPAACNNNKRRQQFHNSLSGQLKQLTQRVQPGSRAPAASAGSLLQPAATAATTAPKSTGTGGLNH